MTTKKKLISRISLGFPIGIAIGHCITLLISLGWGKGVFSPCVPQFEAMIGNQLKAVALQTLLCGLLGSGFAGASVIWELETWSLLKQTGVYFAVIASVMLPVAYIACWMEHSLWGFLMYFSMFLFIFVAMWVSQYLAIRGKVRRMNERLRENRREER